MSKELNGILKSWEATVRQSVGHKKANGLFTPMSVAHVDDDEEELEPGQVHHVEKFLSSGDSYSGQWLDNFPHGNGKYIWADGCVYVGEWRKGKKTGKGTFTWPSGATYEGEFKNEYVDGNGSYTGFSGDTYKGSWMRNMKHGQGIETYPCGDYYEGEWVRGLKDGQGKYHWVNGDHYSGEWKDGMIHGNGEMVWSNGNSFEGCWENGIPKGYGTFKWDNGDMYVGFWSSDPSERDVSYDPSGGSDKNQEWDPQELYSMHLKSCKMSPCERLLIYPSQKKINISEAEGEVMQKQSVHGRLSNQSVEDTGSPHHGASIPRAHRPLPLRLKATKRQGVTISKGHKNYELMLNLQLGIRY